MAAITRLLRSATRYPGKLTYSSLSNESRFPASLMPSADASLGRKREAERNVQWVFLGCPGVGKGTYASRLSNLLGVPHIATGDLVRDELKSDGPLSKKLADIVNQGKLVSDEIIIKLLYKRLENGQAKGESGFILDGFPRTLKQAEILDKVIDIDLVVNLKIREEVLIEKCLGRRICSQCGGNFNVASINLKGENGRPDVVMAPLLPPENCASKLITRADDTEEVVKKRLNIYYEMSQPVEEFYQKQGKLMEFELPGGIPESWPKLLHALNLDDNDQSFSICNLYANVFTIFIRESESEEDRTYDSAALFTPIESIPDLPATEFISVECNFQLAGAYSQRRTVENLV